jgi:hypothetical protein
MRLERARNILFYFFFVMDSFICAPKKKKRKKKKEQKLFFAKCALGILPGFPPCPTLLLLGLLPYLFALCPSTPPPMMIFPHKKPITIYLFINNTLLTSIQQLIL